jgi:microcystin-dependent protein
MGLPFGLDTKSMAGRCPITIFSSPRSIPNSDLSLASLNGQRLTLSSVTQETLPTSSSTTLPTGSGSAFSIMQPSLGVTYIIATLGIFPSQTRHDLEEAGEGEAHAGQDGLGQPENQSHRRLGGDPYLGEVAMFAGNFAPRGWAKCEGQLLPISSNNALFSLLGTTYGGNGSTNFALPDLRGRVPMGVGGGPGRSVRNLGEVTGSEGSTLTTGNLPSHTHGIKDVTTIAGTVTVA